MGLARSTAPAAAPSAATPPCPPRPAGPPLGAVARMVAYLALKHAGPWSRGALAAVATARTAVLAGCLIDPHTGAVTWRPGPWRLSDPAATQCLRRALDRLLADGTGPGVDLDLVDGALELDARLDASPEAVLPRAALPPAAEAASPVVMSSRAAPPPAGRTVPQPARPRRAQAETR